MPPTHALASEPSTRSSKGLNASLWIAQVLALAFGMAGLVRLIGASELAGALGLLLPSLTRIQPRLTPLAALCLVLVMLLASAFHLSLGEVEALPVNVVLGGLALLVAWGRSQRAPIPPRG